MNEIIKNIEAAQLKAEVPEFKVGDTVRVHNLIKEGNREDVYKRQFLKRSVMELRRFPVFLKRPEKQRQKIYPY